jgi:energy-coupling factor transporter ATP-binding protein EcfA2
MKILAFEAHNFKRLHDVRIDPGGRAVVVLTGRNGAGKSSVLDAIWAAIGGAPASPEVPVRRGESEAFVRLDLGDLRVTRRWEAGGKTALYVDRTDGTKASSPQALLDRLVGLVAFDPYEFTRWPAKDQAKVLMRLAGLEGPFAGIDAAAKEAEEERARVNREIRKDEGALASYPPEGGFAGVPDDEVGAGELLASLKALFAEKEANDGVRAAAAADRERARKAAADLEAAGKEAQRLRDQLAKAEQKITDLGTKVSEAHEAAAESEAVAASLSDPDVDSLQARVKDADATNALVRKKRERAAVAARVAAARERSAALTGSIASCRAEKEARLSEARYPVAGLDVRGDVVLFGGVPLAQASSAQQVRLGLAVGAALNPGLRVAVVRDGSLLDEDSSAAVRAWAEETDFQVWVEKVGSAGSDAGVVIEDGGVLADRDGVPAAPAPSWKDRLLDAALGDGPAAPANPYDLLGGETPGETAHPARPRADEDPERVREALDGLKDPEGWARDRETPLFKPRKSQRGGPAPRAPDPGAAAAHEETKRDAEDVF